MSDIKLRADQVDKTEVHGFAHTREGREFLRQLYKRAVSFGHLSDGKVATIISDHNPINQAKLEDAVSKALSRWRGGQSEFSKKAPKNVTYLLRVEAILMREPTYRRLLDDQARTVGKLEVAAGFANFLYGLGRDKSLLSKYRSYRKTVANVYKEYFADASENPGIRIVDTQTYHYFIDVDDQDFMLLHSLSISVRGDREIINSHYSGFVYPVEREQLVSFTIDNPSRSIRAVTLWSPPYNLAPDIGIPIGQFNLYCEDVFAIPQYSVWEPDLDAIARSEGKYRILTPKLDIMGKRAAKYIDKQKWNIAI